MLSFNPTRFKTMLTVRQLNMQQQATRLREPRSGVVYSVPRGVAGRAAKAPRDTRCAAALPPAGALLLRRAQVAAAAAPLLSRSSHLCNSLKQSARDALDAIDGAKSRR